MDMLLRFLFFVTSPNLVALGSARSGNFMRPTPGTREFISCDGDEYKDLALDLAENQILPCLCPNSNPKGSNHRLVCQRELNAVGPDEGSESGTLYQISYAITCGKFRRAPVVAIFRPHAWCGEKQGDDQVANLHSQTEYYTDAGPHCMKMRKLDCDWEEMRRQDDGKDEFKSPANANQWNIRTNRSERPPATTSKPGTRSARSSETNDSLILYDYDPCIFDTELAKRTESRRGCSSSYGLCHSPTGLSQDCKIISYGEVKIERGWIRMKNIISYQTHPHVEKGMIHLSDTRIRLIDLVSVGIEVHKVNLNAFGIHTGLAFAPVKDYPASIKTVGKFGAPFIVFGMFTQKAADDIMVIFNMALNSRPKELFLLPQPQPGRKKSHEGKHVKNDTQRIRKKKELKKQEEKERKKRENERKRKNRERTRNRRKANKKALREEIGKEIQTAITNAVQSKMKDVLSYTIFGGASVAVLFLFFKFFFSPKHLIY